MNVHFLSQSEKKRLLAELETHYNIKNLPYLLLETGRKKIRAFSGSLTKEEIFELSRSINIELIGLYIINKKDDIPRISFDSLPLFKAQISKNIINLEESQLQLWLRGHDLDIEAPKGVVILKFEDDLVGIGKSNSQKIFNYVPKERKLKTPMPAQQAA
ncbi:MAG: hypothetical protein AABX73_02390 [Nanoarchaeota archaeon]